MFKINKNKLYRKGIGEKFNAKNQAGTIPDSLFIMITFIEPKISQKWNSTTSATAPAKVVSQPVTALEKDTLATSSPSARATSGAAKVALQWSQVPALVDQIKSLITGSPADAINAQFGFSREKVVALLS